MDGWMNGGIWMDESLQGRPVRALYDAGLHHSQSKEETKHM